MTFFWGKWKSSSKKKQVSKSPPAQQGGATEASGASATHNADSLPGIHDQEIAPYDPHVRVLKGGHWPNIIPKDADWDVFQRYFDAFLANYVETNWDQANILRKHFHAMLPDAMKTCSSTDGSMTDMWKDVKTAVHQSAEVRAATGLSNIVPPDNIHRMQKGDPLWVGDIYSSEMVTEALRKSGINHKEGENYLDFGCSSGSLIRILKAVHPKSQFYGVDPIESAIDWASDNIKGAQFSVSAANPPLRFSDNMFDGVTAISIWSHFADFSALEWFDEMHRIIKPGGWLFFTTHGLNSILHNLVHKRKSPKRVRALFEGLLGADFVFEETVKRSEKDQSLLDVAWGNSYFRPDWVMKNLCDKWDILFFHQGKNQNNQDLYVLRPKNF
ncbi:class I SAM-dependent methyltransferase [Kordiimonas sp. SCSIO 12610]|uniref:class I SAM-dependent methyltransferase n=1 Tax=Kordiimonas sp. SCSIO 12610 TaxID=2829597 RepID=UPI00210C85EB|nr:class I SAM-dependent methyltransferase [Kordiimonas sp. SCSIO 12610]UTW56166.1 class I SAM-dependent methyltransferase [Kordiimonas sp. SCSIO 12610]